MVNTQQDVSSSLALSVLWKVFQLLTRCSGFRPTIRGRPCQVQQREDWAQWWMETRPECFLLAQCMVGYAPAPCVLTINRWGEWMTGFLMVESAAGLPVSQVLLQDPGSRALPWTQDKHGPCGYQKFIGKESADLVYSVCRSVKNGWVAAFFHWCVCTEVPFCSFVDLWCQPVLVWFCSSGHSVCLCGFKVQEGFETKGYG